MVTRPAPANHISVRRLDGMPLGEVRFLQQKPNGDCHHLDPVTGCTIYEHRPAVCRAFSCVGRLRLSGPRDAYRLLIEGAIDEAIFMAGIDRMSRPERRRFMTELGRHVVSTSGESA